MHDQRNLPYHPAAISASVFQKLKHTESDKLQVQIQAYLDNVFDVGALLEDAETKNAALERVEELEENLSHVSVCVWTHTPTPSICSGHNINPDESPTLVSFVPFCRLIEVDVVIATSRQRVTLLLFTDDGEAAGHGERGHVQNRGAGEAADAKEQGS